MAGGLEFASGLSVRGGYIGVLGRDGFYGDKLLEPEENPREIPISKRNHEPWLGVEYRSRWPRAWPYTVFVSSDIRDRTIYDYHRPSPEEVEDDQLSFNFVIGLRSRVQSDERILREIYFRFYQGVNPHGQFRTERDYTYVALGLRFGFDF